MNKVIDLAAARARRKPLEVVVDPGLPHAMWTASSSSFPGTRHEVHSYVDAGVLYVSPALAARMGEGVRDGAS